MKRITFLYLWSLGVGAMDVCTGLMLATVPVLTLTLMKVPAVSSASLVFLSWMGVFITAVGLSYGLVFKGGREGETVWIFTAAVRSLVALFLIWKISTGSLPAAWSLVAVADGFVAAVQWIVLRAGWWKGEAG